MAKNKKNQKSCEITTTITATATTATTKQQTKKTDYIKWISINELNVIKSSNNCQLELKWNMNKYELIWWKYAFEMNQYFCIYRIFYKEL